MNQNYNLRKFFGLRYRSLAPSWTVNPEVAQIGYNGSIDRLNLLRVACYQLPGTA